MMRRYLCGTPGPRRRGQVGRRPQDEVPYAKTTVRILGEAQIETFEAMCFLEHRRPHELAADIVLETIRAGQENHQVQDLVAALRRSRRHLRSVQPGSGAGEVARRAHGIGDPE
jgi:hypothetical protein